MTTNQLAKSLIYCCLGAALAVAQTPSTTDTTKSSTTNSTATKGHTGNHSADHGMSSNQGGGVMVGKPDEMFMTKAAQGGLMEVEAARLAQEKASSNEIKEFARKLEQDHSKANDQLKQLASQKNVQLPSDVGSHRAMLDKMKGLSGEQFDKAWMKMQVQHHKKDVNEFNKETTRAMDSDLKQFATSTLPTLQDHLRQAEQLQGSTRGRKADKAPADKASTSDSSSGSNSDSSSSKPKGDNNPTTKQ